jgi:hypothetical protein
MWLELREVLWLATMLGGLSTVSVGLAIALAVALEHWAAVIPTGGGQF